MTKEERDALLAVTVRYKQTKISTRQSAEAYGEVLRVLDSLAGDPPAAPQNSINESFYKVVLAERNLAWAEIERLTACLKKANATAEHFELEWYLRGDEIERARRAALEEAANVCELEAAKNDSYSTANRQSQRCAKLIRTLIEEIKDETA